MKQLLLKSVVAAGAIATTLPLSANWEQIYELPQASAHYITKEGLILMSDLRDNLDGGIYYSEDKGKTFTKCEVADYAYNKFVEIGDYIYAPGKACRIARSEDGGRTWEVLNYTRSVEEFYEKPGMADETVCYAIDGLDGVLYVGDFLGGGVIKSEDNGETWTHTDRESQMVNFGDEKAMDNYYNMMAFNNEIYLFGLYSVHKYNVSLDRWEIVPVHSNCLATVTIAGDIMIAGRATENQNPDTEYLLATKDGYTWDQIFNPEADNLNVRCIDYDGKYLYAAGPNGRFYYTDNMGEEWYNGKGLPENCWPLVISCDDDYVYTTVYHYDPSQVISGLWRYPKSSLASSAALETLKYDNLSVNVDGNTLTVTVPAENIRISDVAGKQAIHLNNTSNVDLGVLTPGVYLYEVVAGGTRVVGKFVK